MNKKVLFVLLGIIGFLVLVFFLSENRYLGLDFVDINWNYGSETLIFEKNGNFHYYESSGNSVGDYDLCERYRYNRLNGKVKLLCSENLGSEEKLKVIKYDYKTLKISIAGETKTFARETDYDEDFVGFWITNTNGKNEYLNIWRDGSISYQEDKIVSIEEFEENRSYYDDNCGEYSRNEEDNICELKCSIDLDMGRHYIYNRIKNKLVVYGTESENEMEIKIISMNKENLEVKFNGEVKKFKLDR